MTLLNLRIMVVVVFGLLVGGGIGIDERFSQLAPPNQQVLEELKELDRIQLRLNSQSVSERVNGILEVQKIVERNPHPKMIIKGITLLAPLLIDPDVVTKQFAKRIFDNFIILSPQDITVLLETLDKIKFLEHPNPIQRSVRIIALMRIVEAHPEGLPTGMRMAIERFSQDEDPLVLLTTDYMIQRGVQLNPNVLIRFIKRNNHPIRVRRRLLELMKGVNGDSALVPLFKEIALDSGENYRVRAQAIMNLGQRNNSGSTEILQRILAESKHKIKQLNQKPYSVEYLEFVYLTEITRQALQACLERSL